jgi:protein-tyrosine phosphatase
MRTNPPDATPVFGSLFVGSAPEGSLDELCPWEVVVFTAKEFQPEYPRTENKLLIYAPIRDANISKAEKDMVLRVAKELAHNLMRGARVLVTCAQGLNRSAVFAAATMIELGLSPRQAIADIRSARGPKALFNPSFVDFLEGLA